jgi:hypothetical protein
MSSTTYDRLKLLAQIVLPALGTLYFTIAGIWHLPAAEQVVGTIVAIDAFIGVILKVASDSYTKEGTVGTIVVHDSEEKTTFTIEQEMEPEKLMEKKEVTFKVRKA